MHGLRFQIWTKLGIKFECLCFCWSKFSSANNICKVSPRSSITPSKQSDCDIESQILSSPDTNQRYYWALLKRKTDDKTYTLFLCLSITIKLLLALRKITECSMLIFLIIAHWYQTTIQHRHLYNCSFYLVQFSADDTKNVMNNQSPIKTWSLIW